MTEFPPDAGVVGAGIPYQRRGADRDVVLCCSYCGRRLARDREQFAVLADSSFLHPSDPIMDGHRAVAVCSDEHLDRLRAAAPRFVEEQLWALKLERVTDHRRPGSLAARSRRAGLTVEQAQRAVRWRSSHDTRSRPDLGGPQHSGHPDSAGPGPVTDGSDGSNADGPVGER